MKTVRVPVAFIIATACVLAFCILRLWQRPLPPIHLVPFSTGTDTARNTGLGPLSTLCVSIGGPTEEQIRLQCFRMPSHLILEASLMLNRFYCRSTWTSSLPPIFVNTPRSLLANPETEGSNHRLNGCIAILLTAHFTTRKFASPVARNLGSLHDCQPVVIFTYEDSDADRLRMIFREHYCRKASVIVVAIPEERRTIPPQYKGIRVINDSPEPYKIMCEFYAFKILLEFANNPLLQKFDYYTRFDGDMALRAPIPFNIYDVMSKTGLHYVATADIPDHKNVSVSIYRAVRSYDRPGDFAVPVGMVCDLFESKFYSRGFFGSFSFVDIRFFTQPKILRFVNYMISVGGVFTERWSDQNVWPILVILFNATIHGVSDARGVCLSHKNASLGLSDNLMTSAQFFSNNTPPYKCCHSDIPYRQDVDARFGNTMYLPTDAFANILSVSTLTNILRDEPVYSEDEITTVGTSYVVV